MQREMIEKSIRQAVRSGHSDLIRDLLLNENQLSLLECIEAQGEMTAHRLALMDDLSIANASAKLNRLHRAGYVTRASRSAETGGIEFVYRSQP